MVIKVKGREVVDAVHAAVVAMAGGSKDVQFWREGRGRGTAYVVKHPGFTSDHGEAIQRLLAEGITPERCTLDRVAAEIKTHREQRQATAWAKRSLRLLFNE